MIEPGPILVADGWTVQSQGTCCGNKTNYIKASKPGWKIQIVPNGTYFFAFDGAFCVKADYLENLQTYLNSI